MPFTETETQSLFKVIEELKSEGKAYSIYITD